MASPQAEFLIFYFLGSRLRETIPIIDQGVNLIGNGVVKLETTQIIDCIINKTPINQNIILWIHSHGAINKGRHQTDDFGDTEELFKKIGQTLHKKHPCCHGASLTIVFQSCYSGQAINYIDYFPQGTEFVFSAPAEAVGFNCLSDYCSIEFNVGKSNAAEVVFHYFQRTAKHHAIPALVVSGKKDQLIHYQAVVNYLNGKTEIIYKYYPSVLIWLENKYHLLRDDDRLLGDSFDFINNQLKEGCFNFSVANHNSAKALLLAEGFTDVFYHDPQVPQDLKQNIKKLQHDSTYFRDIIPRNNHYFVKKIFRRGASQAGTSRSNDYINSDMVEDSAVTYSVWYDKINAYQLYLIVSIIENNKNNRELKALTLTFDQGNRELSSNNVAAFKSEHRDQVLQLISSIITQCAYQTAAILVSASMPASEDIVKSWQAENYASVMRIIKEYKIKNKIETPCSSPDPVFSGTIFEHILSHIPKNSLLEIKNAFGKNLLHAILEPENSPLIEIVAALFYDLPKENCLEIKNNYGWTIFHYIIDCGNIDVLKKLFYGLREEQKLSLVDDLLSFCRQQVVSEGCQQKVRSFLESQYNSPLPNTTDLCAVNPIVMGISAHTFEGSSMGTTTPVCPDHGSMSAIGPLLQKGADKVTYSIGRAP